MTSVSIIIPHRGPQELLDRCVASIPQRDDVETIVVIDEEGRGAGWARNQALERARGEYVIFADSDDFFHPCFNEFLDTLKGETADVVFFNANSIEQSTSPLPLTGGVGGGSPSWRANHLNRIMRSNDRAWQEKHLRYYFTEPWCKAVRMSLIREHGIRFDESKILNDIYFSSQVGVFAKTVKVYNEKCYCVCNMTTSTGKKKSGEEKALDYTRETAKSNVLLKKYGIKHHHSRMIRPFVLAILKRRFSLAYKCWKEMRATGISKSFLIYCLIRYPRDLTKLIYRKLQSNEI